MNLCFWLKVTTSSRVSKAKQGLLNLETGDQGKQTIRGQKEKTSGGEGNIERYTMNVDMVEA